MLPERFLNDAVSASAGGSLWASTGKTTAQSSDILTNQPMLRNGLFKRKTEQRDQAKTTRSGKYPFKWTLLGLVIFCSAFWAALFWLFFR